MRTSFWLDLHKSSYNWLTSVGHLNCAVVHKISGHRCPAEPVEMEPEEGHQTCRRASLCNRNIQFCRSATIWTKIRHLSRRLTTIWWLASRSSEISLTSSTESEWKMCRFPPLNEISPLNGLLVLLVADWKSLFARNRFISLAKKLMNLTARRWAEVTVVEYHWCYWPWKSM